MITCMQWAVILFYRQQCIYNVVNPFNFFIYCLKFVTTYHKKKKISISWHGLESCEKFLNWTLVFYYILFCWVYSLFSYFFTFFFSTVDSRVLYIHVFYIYFNYVVSSCIDFFYLFWRSIIIENKMCGISISLPKYK